jgi:ATP-dependent Clp protease adaptor protein ClpS
MSTATPDTQRRTQTQAKTEPRQPWLWNVVLLDDDEHTYDYVINLAQELFNRTIEEAFLIARTVDTDGRAILTTTHREHAELKREQAIAFGRDLLLAKSSGPMRVVLEPACDAEDDSSE